MVRRYCESQKLVVAVLVGMWIVQYATAVPAQQTGPIALATSQRFIADERLSAELPTGVIELGQPVPVRLSLAAATVAFIGIYQRGASGDMADLSQGGYEMAENPKILDDQGRTKVLALTPLQTGRISVDIVVVFTDGGIAHQSYPLDVIPSSKGLRAFRLNGSLRGMAIVLKDKPEARQRWLRPEVSYDQLKYPILLYNTEGIPLSVEQDEDRPVIKVDDNGLIHGLRPGVAKVTGDFDGVKDTVKVEVFPDYGKRGRQ